MPPLFTVSLIQIGVGILLFIALLNGQRDLTVLTLLVLAVMSGTRLWARLSLSGLDCHFTVDKHKAFPGEKLDIRISAENGKLLPIWLELHIPIGSLLQRSDGPRVLTKQSSLLWYQGIQFQWELIAERRGVYPIGPLHILTGDLFSFFTKHERIGESHSIIVYPRLVPLQAFSLPRRDFFGVPRATSPVQDPIYILGTRDYQHGQPAKYIHWKASARHNRLQEKVFEPSVQEKVLLVVDVARFAECNATEGFESSLEIAASLAARLDREGHAVGLITNGSLKGGGAASVPVTRNYRQLSAILETLARLEMKPEKEIKDLLRRRLADTWGISCIYFAYEADETVSSAQEYLTQRQTPALFLVCRSRMPTGKLGLDSHRKLYCLDDIRLKEVASQ